MKHVLCIVFLFCCTVAYGQSGYSHAKELGLKGKVKTMKEYSYEGYCADDGSFHKRGEHYFQVAITEFNKNGNIINKTVYNFNTTYAKKQVDDSIASTDRTIYHYNGKTYTGNTEYTNEVKTMETTRTTYDDFSYTDSVYGFIQPGGIERLIKWQRKHLKADYSEDSSEMFIFYGIATYIARDSKKVSVELIPVKQPSTEQMQRIATDEYNKKDNAGNRLSDVWATSYKVAAGEDVEISEYYYEYY